jgi:hypothetical protein
MTNILTNDEKKAIANSHKRSLETDQYNIQLSIIEENSVLEPNDQLLSTLNQQLISTNARIAALDSEIATLTE